MSSKSSRISMKELTLVQFHKDVAKHVAKIEMKHPVPRFCQESRWPHTGKLTSDEIKLMRDTFAGPRMVPSVVQSKNAYDRVTCKGEDWNEFRTHRDDRLDTKRVGVSGRLDDFNKPVPITSSTVYGKRHKDFYDLKSQHGMKQEIKSFWHRGGAVHFPPLVTANISLGYTAKRSN